MPPWRSKRAPSSRTCSIDRASGHGPAYSAKTRPFRLAGYRPIRLAAVQTAPL